MADFREQAYKAWDDGYRVIPVNKNKNPAINSWKKYQTERMSDKDIEKYFADCWGIALLMGNDMGLIALDFDLKYDLSRTVMKRFKEQVGEDLIRKCYLQSTMNGGYHLVFSCPEMVKGNKKLACRHTTAFEQHKLYMEYWNDPATRTKAINAAYQDKVRVLVETREEGGYILIPGSPGYQYITGEIQVLTKEEVIALYEAAYSVNEVKGLAKVFDEKYLSQRSRNVNWDRNPYEDFNENFDFVGYLEEHGWEVVSQTVKNIRLKRPDTKTKDSAVYDLDTNRFWVFSTSTVFEENKLYSHVDAVCLMEFDSDSTMMYNYLIENGYGQ